MSFLVQILRFNQKASAFPPFGVFSREISRFFFLFLSDSEAKDRNESFLFFQRSRAGASFSSFLSFSFLSADLMRTILFYEERSGRGRVLVRENLPLERDEFALYARIGNAQNELFWFFF